MGLPHCPEGVDDSFYWVRSTCFLSPLNLYPSSLPWSRENSSRLDSTRRCSQYPPALPKPLRLYARSEFSWRSGTPFLLLCDEYTTVRTKSFMESFCSFIPKTWGWSRNPAPLLDNRQPCLASETTPREISSWSIVLEKLWFFEHSSGLDHFGHKPELKTQKGAFE